MKPYHSILILVFALMVACNGNKQDPEPEVAEQSRSIEGPSPALSAIDSLMWLQPDSALACLLPYFDTCCRDAMIASPETPDGDFMETHTIETHAMRLYDRHYAHLLLAELLYKNYYAQTNRPELLQAVAYFDSLVADTHGVADTRGVSLQGSRRRDARRASAQNTAFLDARAHYINGVGYYEQDSVVPACKEYLKAVEVMEEHFEEEELVGKKAKFMALTYSHLTSIFSDMYLHEQAIYFGKFSLHYFNKHEAPPQHIAWALDEIGLHFDILENYDSADYYYKKGIKILSDTNSSTFRDIETHLAFLSYKKGSLVTPLKHLQTIKAQAESVHEYASRCLTIGEIYYHEHLFDSAWLYLNLVYNKSQSIGSKKQAAEWLAEIAKIQGRKAEVLEYTSFLVPFANVEENQSGIKTQLTKLYNESKQTHLNHQQHKETQKRIRLGLSVIGILFLVIIFLFFKSIKQKKNLETERLAHKIQQAALAGRLKKSHQELRELKSQIKHTSSVSKAQAISFVEEPMCQMIIERVNEGQFKSQMDCSVYKDYALSKEQLSALREAANRHFSQFTTRLVKSYPKLTPGDLNYCCLYLLDMSEADISALMQRAYSTVSDRSRKLKTIFGCTDPLSITLHRIANNETID